MLVNNEISLGIETSKGNYIYVSHAHGDHARKGSNKLGVIMSPITAELIDTNAPMADLKGIKLIDSGHILGSSQLVAETDGGKLVYTGDIRMPDSLLFPGAKVEQCDTLIIESTYGNPSIKFPDCWEVYREMQEWVKNNCEAAGRNIIFGAYPLGKSQEIIRLMNEIGIIPVVDRKTDRFCQIYEKHGVALDWAKVGTDKAEETMKGPFVAIGPPSMANRELAHKMHIKFRRPALSALATGLGNYYRFNVDKVFPLSDHADFGQLISYIEQANPKLIYTHHGSSDGLAYELRKRGYNAYNYSSLVSSQRLFSV